MKEEFAEIGATVIAGTVDTQEQTSEVAADLSFPVAYGMTREQGDSVGAWWEERRDHIQPSEFVLTANGTVMMSAYSNSPVGRMDPDETLTLLQFLTARRAQKSG